MADGIALHGAAVAIDVHNLREIETDLSHRPEMEPLKIISGC